MRNILILTVLFSAGAFVSAQQTSSATSQFNQGCPIGFDVQVDGRLIARTIDDERTGATGPLLAFKFSPRGNTTISNATVTVHGLASSGRYLLVRESTTSAAIQSFHLTSGQRAIGLRDADVRVDKIISVDWVELNSVKYADGSQWLATSNERCHAVPSKLLLIGAVGEKVQR